MKFTQINQQMRIGKSALLLYLFNISCFFILNILAKIISSLNLKNNFSFAVFLVSVYLSVLSTQLHAQNIMSYEQYQKIDHAEPYIYEIESNIAALLVFGSRHSFDPRDPQMNTLVSVLNRFAPDLILTEAFPKKFDYSLNQQEAIRTSGEFGLTWKLANEQSIPVYSLEPERETEIEYLKQQGWSDIQLMLYYTLRQVAQSQSRRQLLDFSKLVPQYLNSLEQRYNLNGPTAIEAFEEAVEKLLPSVENWQKISLRYFYPGPQEPEYFTNRISTDSNKYRDRHHVIIINEAVQKWQKVFVVTGSAHAVMQEFALRSILVEK